MLRVVVFSTIHNLVMMRASHVVVSQARGLHCSVLRVGLLTILFGLVPNINHHRLRHRFIGSLGYRHAPSKVLMGTAVAALARRHAIAAPIATLDSLGPTNISGSLISITSGCRCRTQQAPSCISCSPSVALKEICPRLTLLLRGRWAIEIVKHQVHIGSLFPLQMINDCFVSMYLNLDICLGLAG